MRDQGVRADLIRFVEMPPPDMPGRWPPKAIDAYFVASRTRHAPSWTARQGFSITQGHLAAFRVLRARRDGELTPSALQSCGISFGHRRERRVGGDPPRRRRPAGVSLFPAGEKLIQYVLTQPPDRVSYRMLTPGDDEMQMIADMGLAAGILDRHLDVRDLVDRQFIPDAIAPARIDAPGPK